MSTLIRLLNGLNQKETKEFLKFLNSPYFNHRKDVIALFEYYLKGKSFLTSNLDKPALFNHVYPNEVYDDAKTRHLLSYLTSLVKQYYAVSSFRENNFQQQFNLTKKLKRKGLNKDFEKEWSKAQQINIKLGFQNTQYHLQQYLLHLQKSEFLSQQKRKGDSDMQTSINELNNFYIASILKQNCSILNYQKMSSETYNAPLLDEILEKVDNHKLKNVPAIAVYYYCLLTLKEPQNKEHYNQLKKIIRQYRSYFKKSEIKNIYLIAINYCIKKLNGGQRAYIREAFEWYREGLKNEVLLENGILSLFTYKNILNLGLELKEFDWIEKYLVVYKAYLNEIDRENHFTYCQAVFYFNKPDYNSVLSLLQKVNFENKLHQLDARRMLLRIYYEQNEINALESLLDSFQIYINRQKDIGYHKDHYLNLIRFVRKFLNYNLRNKSICKKLALEIEKTNALAERKWLLRLLA